MLEAHTGRGEKNPARQNSAPWVYTAGGAEVEIGKWAREEPRDVGRVRNMG